MRVLVASDRSVPARTAALWLTAFPLPPAAELMVLAAIPPMPPVVDLPLSPVLIVGAAADAHEAAETAVATLRARWPAATARVADGDPRRVIPEMAAAWGAELVVVGARGLGTWSRALLGSVSSFVVHHAPCPVLVVRGQPRELRTAVVAIDGSPHARAAAGFLAALPLDHRLTVRLVGVVEDTPGTRAPRLVPGVREAIEAFAAHRREQLGKALDDVAGTFEPHVAVVDRDIRTGSVVAEILTAAKDADLLVVGARGVGALDRLIVGSVSEGVLHQAPCPVLVAKPRATT